MKKDCNNKQVKGRSKQRGEDDRINRQPRRLQSMKRVGMNRIDLGVRIVWQDEAELMHTSDEVQMRNLCRSSE